MINKMDINAQAIEIRRKFDEDEVSPVDVFTLVNQIPYLTLVMYPLGNHISGMCIKNDKANLIAVNSGMSYGRQRFSLAHELYHLFYDNDVKSTISSISLESTDENEKKANQFASYFLAPYGALRKAVMELTQSKSQPLTLKNIISLEQQYGMSHQAMLCRLVDDGYMTSVEANVVKPGVISEAKRYGFDDSLYLPTDSDKQMRTLGYYLQQADTLYESEVISTGKYEELLIDAFRHDIVYGDIDSEGMIND